jgi:uncharacterized repeat protein (TIGR01451 family)
VDFDPGSGMFVLKAENFDIFILKLNSDGNFVWAKSMGSESSDNGKSIYVDSRGNVYTTGVFSDTLFVKNGDTTIILNNDSRPWNNVFILKINQDSCAYMSLVLDSISDLSCLSSGYISAHALDGLPPYSYTWNTTPQKKDSFASFSSPGIYSLTITDSNKCWRSISTLFNGPIFFYGFDLNLRLTTRNFRPGRSTHINAEAYNEGCMPVAGKFSIVFDDLVKYDKALPAPDKIIGDTLIWNFTNLTYDSKPLKPEIYVTTNTKATIGDTICFDVIITPIIGDSNTKNNIKRYCYPVRNSYDPNIKSVYPAGACKENYALKNEVLTYTVQFQNTGTADAIDIFILDSLDVDLDINTLRVVGQSHQPMITEVLPGGVLKFDFRNIHLPDSGKDEKGSHGYVIYEITPKTGLPNGTKVTGNAGIYFDFNPPVMTNTVMNTLVSTIPSCNVGIESLPDKLPALRVYPNPTPGHLTIDLKQAGTVTIYDMVGNLLFEGPCIVGQNNLDIFALANGIYLLKANGAGVRLVKVQ